MQCGNKVFLHSYQLFRKFVEDSVFPPVVNRSFRLLTPAVVGCSASNIPRLSQHSVYHWNKCFKTEHSPKKGGNLYVPLQRTGTYSAQLKFIPA